VFAIHPDDESALQTVFFFLCVSGFGVYDGELALLDSLIACTAFQDR